MATISFIKKITEQDDKHTEMMLIKIDTEYNFDFTKIFRNIPCCHDETSK